MLELSRNLRNLAARQHGYFTAKQAKACGLAKRLHSYHAQAGNWLKYHNGLYRLPGYTDSRPAEFTRWAMWSRNHRDQPQGVISHFSALEEHGLWIPETPDVHLTVPPAFRKISPPGGVIHKASLSLSVIESRGGYLVTRLPQTLLDLRTELRARGQWDQVLRRALDSGALTAAEAANLESDFAASASPQPPPALSDPAVSTSVQAGAVPDRHAGSELPPLSPSPVEPARGTERLQLSQRERTYQMICEQTRRTASRRRAQAGFTLVELLVVTAIISVLAAMLLPVLERANATAKCCQCVNNLKQTSLAMELYCGDYQNFEMHYYWLSGKGDWTWKSLLLGGKYLENNQASLCPCYPPYPGAGSTKYNALGRFNTMPSGAGISQNTGSVILSYTTPAALKHPANTMHFLDSAGTKSTATVTYHLQCWSVYNSGGTTGEGVIHMRHENRANVSFYDNHVETCAIPRLKESFHHEVNSSALNIGTQDLTIVPLVP